MVRQSADAKRALEAQRKRLAEEKKKREEASLKAGQIVEVPATKDDRPNNSRFSSQFNTNVEKETVARKDSAPYKKPSRLANKVERRRVQGSRARGGQQQRLKKGDGAKKDSAKKAGEGGKRFILEVPDMQQRDDVQLRLSELPGGRQRSIKNRPGAYDLKGNSKRLRVEMGGEDGGGGRSGSEKGEDETLPDLASLAPTFGTIARLNGSPEMRQHIEDIPEGDGTFLNTREFKYATFFYRIRDSVYDQWEPMLHAEYRRRDPTGRVYGNRTRSTTLQIRLTPDGRLDQIDVAERSGIDFLDEVALRAWQQAQPFPNPPRGMQEDDGRIRFFYKMVVLGSAGSANPFKF